MSLQNFQYPARSGAEQGSLTPNEGTSCSPCLLDCFRVPVQVQTSSRTPQQFAFWNEHVTSTHCDPEYHTLFRTKVLIADWMHAHILQLVRWGASACLLRHEHQTLGIRAWHAQRLANSAPGKPICQRALSKDAIVSLERVCNMCIAAGQPRQ